MAGLNDQLDKPCHIIANQRKISITHLHKPMIGSHSQSHSLRDVALANPSTTENDDQENANEALPYRYHEDQQDFQLAGWRLPAHYQLNADDLQNWLLNLPNWQRIKGVVRTCDGWLQINFNPGSLTTKTIDPQTDSRLEIILQLGSADNTAKENETDDEASSVFIDWEDCDRELMAMII